MITGKKLGRGTCILWLLTAGCGGLDRSDTGDVPGVQPVGSATSSTPAASPPPSSPQVSGRFLATVNLTPTHSVQLWELEPGNVVMLQTWNAAAGEQRLELSVMMQEAGGHFGDLYRKLLNDDSATVPPELAAADDHRAHLPMRDGASPLPAPVAPPLLPESHGDPGSSEPATSKPGDVKALTLYSFSTWAADPSFCTWNQVDGGWCPPGAYYGWATGASQETIYWEGVGANPQSGAATAANTDTFTLSQIAYGSGLGVWATALTVPVPPGYAYDILASGSPVTYQGSITGTLVSYAERHRLSFPSLSYVTTYPNGAHNVFTNDINGITHDASKWIISRTNNELGINGQGSISPETHGCIGTFPFGNSLQNPPSPTRCPYGEPSALSGIGFLHYGDLVYDFNSNLIYVSTNMPGSHNGAIAVLSDDLRYYYGEFIINRYDQVGWVALNPKNSEFYTSSSSATTIHQHQLWFASTGLTGSTQYDINLVNASYGAHPLGNIQGGKVSSHGKLWVWATVIDTVYALYGIDPYTGIVQVVFDDRNVHPGNYSGTPEAEGLDITENNVGALGIGGQIHVQELGNNSTADDTWSMLNIAASDLSRL